LIRKILTIDI